ncbi:hypothetical protein San01_23530 [Streptomyces angustmyceticus]|uniref:Uncharacterized protein n=1 Tax=Streptomyces angustmyceticus TaxID=285578 RepID=A0A5J4LEN3_9ACTN|nr:hypothetical protein San01_23530 [Streptomyces angustmyceticus]
MAGATDAVTDVVVAMDVVVDSAMAVDAALAEDVDSAAEAVSSDPTGQLRGWSPAMGAGLEDAATRRPQAASIPAARAFGCSGAHHYLRAP